MDHVSSNLNVCTQHIMRTRSDRGTEYMLVRQLQGFLRRNDNDEYAEKSEFHARNK